LHMKENGFLLGTGGLDWNAIGRALHETGYMGDGWMQIEGAMPDGGDLVQSYKHNLQFLRNILSKPV
jgi:L-ribulose-5-phosphate 3-epimerase